ncbi:MAG: dihydroorotate dehydrogenase electron transfer subunit [Lachnospiraceae bacterium]|jgi:dihydroorotate dehydrogenase electron transfer subunit
MKQCIFEIKSQRRIAPDVFEMKLKGDTSDITAPGQFVNIAIDGFYLRRPISVCDCEEGLLTIIYKIAGKGTEKMATMNEGDKLDILTGLGNGYDLARSGDKPILLGGGTGVPPMYKLAKELTALGKDVHVVLGFNTAEEVFYENEFRGLGCKVAVTTVDGSSGTYGLVTDALDDDFSYFYACGPEPMLKAVYNATRIDGEMSFEERMGCGFGACMGCSCRTLTGSKRICKDGPVMRKEEILWED